MIVTEETVELATAFGAMRVHVVKPVAAGKFPGIVFFSEIFQITGPIRRTAAMLAGHGYVVARPEIYHEFEEAGAVFAYDQAGSDRGNKWKTEKELSSYDADATAVVEHLVGRADCSGAVGAMGICIGGHLAFRAAMHEKVRGTVCFYATDIHAGSLAKGGDDSYERAKDIKGELMMVWGRQDPHIPLEGRRRVMGRLDELNLAYSWYEVNGAHAFLRDEGARYDPELALQLMGAALGFFHRTLAVGGTAEMKGSAETRH